MNPKIGRTYDELARTKAKIAELQALVPQLERNITDMENTEIIKAVRSVDIALNDLPALLSSLKERIIADPKTDDYRTTGSSTPARDKGIQSNHSNEGDHETITTDEGDDADV